MKQPLISFVTHGRNDGFMGDFLWRVATCINQIARNYAALGRLDEIEILIGDWGSEQKTMREAMKLEPAARRVTRFCTVSPAVAARLNQDGDYGYSPAANIPIRRAQGKFIFSMDSDAWMPLKTAEYLLQIADGKNPTGLDLDKSFFWASRQHIPFPFISTSPSIEALDRYLVEQRDKMFWTGKCNMKEFRGGAVAIFGKRELFHAIRGYNEALVHWGWHDIDIHCRMAMAFVPHDLWDLGAEMFHMEHYPKRGGEVAGGRKLTPQIVPTQPVVNGPDWGAINDSVDVSSAPDEPLPVIAKTSVRVRNIVISGTNFWNPGDDFVRDGITRVLREVFPGEPLNFLFYNFNADFFPQSKFAGIGNYVSQGDLEKYRDDIDAVVIAGLSAGDEIKDLYRWVVANNLASKVWLMGAGYENGYVEQHIAQEPEATIFRQARVVTGRTAKTPEFFQTANIPYHHLNCPAILSVPEVKNIPVGKRIERIGFSIQLPTGEAVVNHGCARSQYELSVALLRELAQQYAVEVIAHHKWEYFHFLNLLRGENIPVIFSSFYQDLHQIYPRYDLLITTRLHSSLFANGHGIPGIIINDTDRHTHTLDGFLHSIWVNNREKFNAAFARWKNSDLIGLAAESAQFKTDLLARYVAALRPVAVAEAINTASDTKPNTSLPVNFFTIVLNGLPFLQHHIEQMRQLPFAWHWHLVEGVAELNHDTGWSKATGGKIPTDLQCDGLSVDGTTEYLDALKKEFPDNITLYRPPAGKFWDGKRAMVNAPLANLTAETLLWQIDADELWTATQIIRTRALFLTQPTKMAAYFFCHYFVGPELVTTSRDTYGNNSSYEWLRVWRYQPGDQWIAHEPPRLCRNELDVAALNSFRHAETEAFGLVFQHYAYATEAQVQFKESYYGYPNAVAQWRQLQAAKNFPAKLAEHFAWVNDGTVVNSAQSAGLQRLAPDAWLGLATPPEISPLATNLDGARRILFVRTDSIGDAVLASAMLEPLHRRYPHAQLAVLCQAHVADLFAACPFVSSVICYDRRQVENSAAEHAQILAEIAGFQPDVVLNSVRSRDKFSDELTLAIAGAKHIAIEGDLDNLTPADHAAARSRYQWLVPTAVTRVTELSRHADFLRGLGIEAQNLQPVTWTTPDDEFLADEFFQSQALDPQRTIAVFPGAQHEVRVYHGYANALKNLSGFRFLIFGDAAQAALAEEMETQLPGRTVNLCGRSSLRETIALVKRCRLYVGAESAGAHLACAVGVPNVVLLGGGHFGRFMPYSPLTSAVTLPLDCFGCNWRCPHQRAHCIKDIAPEKLAEAIHQTLAKNARQPRLFLSPAAAWLGGLALPAWQHPQAQMTAAAVEIIELVSPVAPPEAPAAQAVIAEEILVIPAQLQGPEPIVTAVVSTYASEKFMRACLENLSRQTIFDRVEVIVVDSGSPENERAIVAEFQQKFPNIRYVRTSRETLYAAWNRGLGLARGRYFANVNTDDSLRNDALEILAASLDLHADCGFSYADCAWSTQPNDTFPSAHLVKTVKYPNYNPIESLFYCLTGCLQFFRTETLRELGGFDASLKCAGDYEATLKMMAAKMNAVHVPEVLSLFYQNVGGLTQASNRSAVEHDQVMDRYRAALDIRNIFKLETNDAAGQALALAALAGRAESFAVPWEDKPFEHMDFARTCYLAALALDPHNETIGLAAAGMYRKVGRSLAELAERWPHLQAVINRVQAGEFIPVINAQHALLGPVFRLTELAGKRPNAARLAAEPKLLQPWITAVDGRYVYLSEDIFPRPAGLHYLPHELQAGAKRLAALLAELPPFYAHFGGAGDALLLLAAFYDQSPGGIVFSHANGVGSARALFDAFPKLSKIYFLPQHTQPFFHIVLRYFVYELRNCLGAGATPKNNYDEEWKAGLDLEKKYHINKTPRWAAAWRQNENSRRVALAPKGSLTGMVGSKRNLILPELWPQLIAHILARGFEPVILGVPSEAGDYPALSGCVDARGESFPGQMKLIGQCAGLVGADSWAKTFSALADIPTLVFEPIKGADICSWKDASDWVFIEPWPSIKMIRLLTEFQRAFDARIAKIPGTQPPATARPVIAWEGSFLDYGSLSHINRELTARLSLTLDLTRVGPNSLTGRAQADVELQRCAKKLAAKASAETAVTVRHQWPPNWSRPASGSLVVIQPWEYGALPQAWVNAAANVDEFWVPSPLVRAMYLDSGIAPEKVRVVPNGVDTKKFHPGAKPLALKTQKKFKFLFVGGTIFRKGPDLLLAAYAQTFTAADDVCLVIKDFGGDSFYQGQTAEAAIAALQKNPLAPEILYLKDELASEQMPSLYTACDCFVLPYRGEGFGMPVLEAMACGRPVIVTARGATESFVAAEAGWKIPSKMLRLTDHVGDLKLVKNGWLLEPSAPHLGASLKLAASQPDECRKRGAAGRAIVEKKFDWNDLAAAVAHRLKELAELAPVKPGKIASSAKRAPASVAKLLPPPAVAQVGRLDEARELLGQKNVTAAWVAARTAIAQRPFHPEAYLLLAEIALAAGDGKTAKSCAQRARDFAPGWPAAKQFLTKPLKGNAKLDGLSPEAIPNFKSEVSPRLSVCLIVKNEEQFLAQCLESVRGVATQIVVVDTGSTDRTVEIAREFGAEIYSFAWCDDFAAARNAALEHATGDWILMLDADEELPAAQHAKLATDLKNSTAIAFRLPLVNVGLEAEGRSFVPRLFRNAPGVFYRGRIHEQVFSSLLGAAKQWGLKTALGAAELRHHGYTKEMVRDRNKVERNLKLLRTAVEENPADANLLMNLGMELVRSDELAAGIVKYREAFEQLTTQPAGEAPEVREALLTQFTSQLYKVRDHEEVVQILTSPLAEQAPLTASLHLALGLSRFELKHYAEAAEQMRQCLATRQQPGLTPINTDIFTAAPHHCLALCLAKLGDAAGAEKAFVAALAENGALAAKLDYARFLQNENRPVEALKPLHELVTQEPRHFTAWRLGGEIALSHADFVEFARDWTGEAFQALPENPVIAAQRAEALMLNGDPAAAAELWEKIWSSEPDPRTLAALILCELVSHQTAHAPNSEAEPATSQAFIAWYQKLISARAHSVIGQLNEQVEPLARVLPTAARMLEAALTETVATELSGQ